MLNISLQPEYTQAHTHTYTRRFEYRREQYYNLVESMIAVAAAGPGRPALHTNCISFTTVDTNEEKHTQTQHECVRIERDRSHPIALYILI